MAWTCRGLSSGWSFRCCSLSVQTSYRENCSTRSLLFEQSRRRLINSSTVVLALIKRLLYWELLLRAESYTFTRPPLLVWSENLWESTEIVKIKNLFAEQHINQVSRLLPNMKWNYIWQERYKFISLKKINWTNTEKTLSKLS